MEINPDSPATATNKWLIVLRGPPAAGKSAVASALVQKLGSQSCISINLDDLSPPPNFAASMKYQYVVGELFSGRHHSANPKTWLYHYRGAGYKELSVALDVDYDIGLQRYNSDPKRKYNPYWTRALFDTQHKRFYTESKFVNFSKVTGINETRIDVNTKTPTEVADEIIAGLA